MLTGDAGVVNLNIGFLGPPEGGGPILQMMQFPDERAGKKKDVGVFFPPSGLQLLNGGDNSLLSNFLFIFLFHCHPL